MNTDPSVNVVVFEVLIGHRLDSLLGEGPAGAADSIRRVWNGLVAWSGVHSSNVRRVYAQWEPTPDDRVFLDAEFPKGVRVSYSFRRPADRRDWGYPTEEFARAVDAFERQYNAHGVEQVGSRVRRRPWWRYWDWPGEATNPFTG
jgi:hypothetical protein